MWSICTSPLLYLSSAALFWGVFKEPSRLPHATTFHVCLKYVSKGMGSRATLRKEFQSEICGKYTNKIEQFLAAVNPNGDYLVGNKVSCH
ncbi:hypothetical protein HOLleu_37733 [Holothuria leucospilota]|uniref:Secreted protein n=1 Tax=Holothuria leucospilota TaxID=206669 RepID=A0A9Q0YHJ7_HOLLE|nr:hypothetical protein HOLleu_37733 [Holothuria leucospilota]